MGLLTEFLLVMRGRKIRDYIHLSWRHAVRAPPRLNISSEGSKKPLTAILKNVIFHIYKSSETTFSTASLSGARQISGTKWWEQSSAIHLNVCVRKQRQLYASQCPDPPLGIFLSKYGIWINLCESPLSSLWALRWNNCLWRHWRVILSLQIMTQRFAYLPCYSNSHS